MTDDAIVSPSTSNAKSPPRQPVHRHSIHGSEPATDFLTPEQRLDLIAETLATIAAQSMTIKE